MSNEYNPNEFNYVFSGRIVDEVVNMLKELEVYRPVCTLESQINRDAVRFAIDMKREGFYKWLLLDSGAFSVHTGRIQCTQEDYLEYILSIFDDIDMFAQLDTIPGTLNKPKSPQDYVESAEKTWDNYLFLRENVPDKNKIMPIYHFGEDLSYLDRMLNYVDSDGDKIGYIGLAPAKDAGATIQTTYMENMFDHISKSNNPNIKTHLYGFTNLDALLNKHIYASSADSISHRLIAGYNKIYTRHWNKLSIATKPRAAKNKSSISFLHSADEYNKNILRSEFIDKGMDLEFARRWGFEGDDILLFASNSVSAKVVFNMLTIQEYEKDINNTRNKTGKPKKLF